ncbi:hypothetical protein [Lysinibacillus sphaericus]|uniref:hypothetical protein n=1 Tax=Lysinibacillus sphaericus TaxID=1421 RepID=UPI0018CFAD63|nr:hypothetical protein [Lysinibacillus sphaericus]MBG9479390.1 hypothetical protein [Lysinibacillus sphaericus]MBG9479440.1 hypothetical protein [Lysinibacillus sphaericus]
MAQKRKRMTIAEKKINEQVRKELREKGLIPPVKKRLDRKRFLQETFKEFDTLEGYTDLSCLYEAIAWMVSRQQDRNITAEQVGVLKVMKIAVAIKDFYDQKRADGESNYTLGELYEKVIEPIKSL